MNQDFRVVINRKAIADIADIVKGLQIKDFGFIRSAPYEDVHAAYIVLALEEYLVSKRLSPDFKVDLSE